MSRAWGRTARPCRSASRGSSGRQLAEPAAGIGNCRPPPPCRTPLRTEPARAQPEIRAPCGRKASRQMHRTAHKAPVLCPRLSRCSSGWSSTNCSAEPIPSSSRTIGAASRVVKSTKVSTIELHKTPHVFASWTLLGPRNSYALNEDAIASAMPVSTSSCVLFVRWKHSSAANIAAWQARVISKPTSLHPAPAGQSSHRVARQKLLS